MVEKKFCKTSANGDPAIDSKSFASPHHKVLKLGLEVGVKYNPQTREVSIVAVIFLRVGALLYFSTCHTIRLLFIAVRPEAVSDGRLGIVGQTK